MIKVCFVNNSVSSPALLNTFRKMTPKRLGIWKDMVGVNSVSEADYCVVIDSFPRGLEIPPEKIIYIGAHPTSCGGYVCFDDKPCFSKLDLRDQPGLGEWWIEYDYDYLSNLKPTKKTTNLSCIISDQRHYDYHRKRIEFLNEYCKRYPNTIDVYGRINCRQNEGDILKHYKGVCGVNTSDPDYLSKYWGGKESILSSSKYALEFDMGASPEQGKCENYFSERFFDSMLLWCMPIYYGGTNLDKYLPINSFYSIGIFDNYIDTVNTIVNSEVYERNLDSMSEARDLLLNKWQIWPRVYNVIKGIV